MCPLHHGLWWCVGRRGTCCSACGRSTLPWSRGSAGACIQLVCIGRPHSTWLGEPMLHAAIGPVLYTCRIVGPVLYTCMPHSTWRGVCMLHATTAPVVEAELTGSKPGRLRLAHHGILLPTKSDARCWARGWRAGFLLICNLWGPPTRGANKKEAWPSHEVRLCLLKHTPVFS